MRLQNYANVLSDLEIELNVKCRPKSINTGDKNIKNHQFIMDQQDFVTDGLTNANKPLTAGGEIPKFLLDDQSCSSEMAELQL